MRNFSHHRNKRNKMYTKLIEEMHEKFELQPEVVEFTPSEKQFRIIAMREEISEYEVATTKADELDALVDLIVFALGTVYRQGFMNVFAEAFGRVMRANLKKKIGSHKKRGSFERDLVKPEGWTAPDLTDLVGE